MAITQNTYTGDGTTVLFTITFPYLEREHVKASINGTPTTAFTFANSNTIQFNAAPANGAGILLFRETNSDELQNQFFPNSSIPSSSLNNNFTQGLYVAQETDNTSNQAFAASAAAVNTSNIAEANSIIAVNNSIAAVNTSNTAESNSLAAVATSNTAESNSVIAVNTANDAAQAIATAAIYIPIADLTALAALTPANNSYFELVDSTGAESDPSIIGVFPGLVGDQGLTFRLRYETLPGKFVFLGYFAGDAEARYLRKIGGVLTGDVTFNGQSSARFADADSSNYVALQAPATVANDVTWTLPDADGTANQLLATDGAGALNWQTAGIEQLNVIHVDAINGDDANDGHRLVNSKKTIKSAVASASAGDIIKVAPGVYQESLPIDITVTNLSIVGDATRSVFVHPTTATETETMFRCNSGTYIENFTFCGLKAAGARGDHPIDDDPAYGLPEFQGWVAGFYPGAVIRKSPWIENCTNFADSGIDNDNFDPNNYSGTGGDTTSAPTGGGILVDGSLPDVTSPLRSFTINEFTQVCLDGPGLLVCNNGYAQAVSFFGLFCHYHAKALSGGQINMEVGTTNFGRYGIIADGKSATPIFTATANGAAAANDVTFAVNAPTADPSWFGDATRPAINMLVKIGSDTYPILTASPNGLGWNVTISRPDPTDRSINLGLINAHSDTDPVEFFLRSMVSTASHTMEYAGAGTDYSALPENGGVPVELNEAVNVNDGRVWLTSTDQSGKFKVGDTFEVDQQTGYVTVDPNSFSVNLVSDGSPQLGGDLDVLTRRITTSLGNTGVVIEGNGTGPVTLKSGAADKLVVGSSAIDAKVVLNTEGGVRFQDADQSNWVAFQGPATVSSNVTWTLPAADGTSGQVLSTDGSGTLSWATGGGGGGGASVTTSDTAPSTPADGDLWYDSVGGRMYVYYQDPDTSQWVDASPQGGGDAGFSKLEVGNSKVEVIDTGTDGQFVVTTEGSERLRVGPAGQVGLGGANYGTSGQVITSNGTGSAPTWQSVGDGTKIEVGNTKAEVTDTGSNGTFTVTTEGTGRLSVDSSGRTLLGGVTANANGGVLQLSSGITFPATAVASTDPNTLDDYEEGTWTPNQGSGLTVSGTFSSSGRYIKIGNLVYISFELSGSTSVSASATGVVTSNTPFGANAPGSGKIDGGTINVTSGASAISNGGCWIQDTSVRAGTAISATSTAYFSLTYRIP